jgi:alpha-maltose-1-phosphate synthase
MRVLAAIIVPPHLSASGGARAGLRLSEALAEHCDITVAAMSAIDSDRSGAGTRIGVRSWLPAPVRGLPLRYRSLFYASDIPQIVRRGGYDLVHLHNPMPALEMARVARACIGSGIPYVVSTHGFNELANGDAVYGLGTVRRQAWQICVRRPVSQVVKNAAGVFALSPADFEIVKSFGFTGTPTVVPNGVEPPAPAHGAEDRLTWRRFDIPLREEFQGLTCMFLGNHTPNKGVSVLLEAFSRLECPYLLIVGGERRPAIDYNKLARTSRPDQRIVVTGRLSDDEVSALLRRTELFVFPTLADTFPLVVLEAMAHGVPVLASHIGGIPYQLDPDCGQLIPPGDAAALRIEVEKLANDRRRLREMGKWARDRATTKFTWSAAAEAALRGYERACPRLGLAVLSAQRRTGSGHLQENQT